VAEEFPRSSPTRHAVPARGRASVAAESRLKGLMPQMGGKRTFLSRDKKVARRQCPDCSAGWSMPPVILPFASSATDILTPPLANTRS